MNFLKSEMDKQIVEIKTYLNKIIIELEGICYNFEDLEGIELIDLGSFNEIWENYYRLKNEEIQLTRLLRKFRILHLYEDDIKKIICNKNY